jgi:hypothetical protein
MDDPHVTEQMSAIERVQLVIEHEPLPLRRFQQRVCP